MRLTREAMNITDQSILVNSEGHMMKINPETSQVVGCFLERDYESGEYCGVNGNMCYDCAHLRNVLHRFEELYSDAL